MLILAARGGRLIRLDPESGEEIWEVMETGAGWSPPVLLRDRDLVVVPIRPDSVIARRIDDGERVLIGGEGDVAAPRPQKGIA